MAITRTAPEIHVRQPSPVKVFNKTTSSKLEKAKSLIFADNNYAAALKILKTLSKDNPEVLIYLSACYNLTGKPLKAKECRGLFFEWFNQSTSVGRAHLLLVILLHLDNKNEEAAKVGIITIENNNLFSSLSLSEKKELLLFTGTAYSLILTTNEADSIKNKEKAIELLNQCLISGQNKPLDYLSYLSLGRAYKSLAFSKNNAELFNQAYDNYKKALSLNPSSKKACRKLKGLIDNNNVDEVLPQDCGATQLHEINIEFID